MKARALILVVVAGALIPCISEAQVYVLARNEKMDAIQSFNKEDGGTKLLEKATRKEGTWFVLLQSDVKGFGAVFAVCEAGGLNPKYFVAEGELSGSAAIKKARAMALAHKGDNEKLNAHMLQTFENRNAYPLRRITLN